VTGFEVTVLGSSGTYPTPDAPTTGFLLRSGESNVWLDAGTGTFANLQRHTNFFDLDAVVLSHLHLDHILDLYPFYYALRYSKESKGPRGMKVYAPAGARERLEPLASSGGIHHAGFEGFLDFHSIASGDKLNIGDFAFTFQQSIHPVETLGMRIEAGGKTLAYTADTGPSPELTKLAAGADVLIAEASMQEQQDNMTEVHMTAEQAGELAAQARVGWLVLTHIVPGLDHFKSLKQAAAKFGGVVVPAAPNMKIEL